MPTIAAIRRLAVEAISRATGRRLVSPRNVGRGHHDCALASLYWAVPWLSESEIVEAFGYCADDWPYAGITNKEFSIALAYLNLTHEYSDRTETLGEVLGRAPRRAVVLLHGHFLCVDRGRIVGADAYRHWPTDAIVHCCWTFPPRRFRRVRNGRRIGACNK